MSRLQPRGVSNKFGRLLQHEVGITYKMHPFYLRGSAEELREGTTAFPEIPSAGFQTPSQVQTPTQGHGGARPKQLPGQYLPPSSASARSVVSVPTPPQQSSVESVHVDQ